MKKAMFIRGIIIGAAVGASVSLIMPNKKKCCKHTVGRLLKIAGEITDKVSDCLGF